MKWLGSSDDTAGEKRPHTNKTGLVPFELLYPEREGYTRKLTRREPYIHAGYMSDKMAQCRCGAFPVLEQYVEDVDENEIRNVPAQDFVAICPVCEVRADTHGSMEQCIKYWNARRFTEDAVMVRHKLKNPNMHGCEMLSNKVLADAVNEAVVFVKRKHELMRKLQGPIDDDTREIHYTELTRVRANLRKIADFFHKSPLVFTHEEDAILSGVRRNVYPELTPEERLKIPLDLLRM